MDTFSNTSDHQTLRGKVVEPEVWREISSGFRDLTMEQTRTYGQAAAKRIGATALFVVVEDQAGSVVAAACVRVKLLPGLKRGIAWIAAGPLTLRRGCPPVSRVEFVGCIQAICEISELQGHVLRFRLPSTSNTALESISAELDRIGFYPTDHAPPYRTVIVDLQQSEEALFSNLHGKWRNPLRNAFKADIDLEIVSMTDGVGRFQNLYEKVRETKGFRPDIGPDFFRDLSGSDFKQDILFARKFGEDLGAMTIGHCGETATYLFGATVESGRKLNVGHLMMWNSILNCRQLGLKSFDLGGIDEIQNSSVARFKLRTGGKGVTAIGPFEFAPPGVLSKMILGAETVHKKLKGFRS